MFCFPQCRPCDFTVENCFFGISCYSHACVCTIYEKTKAKFPWDQALGESIMFKLKRSVGLEKSVIMLNRLCFVKQLSEHNFFYFCISLSGIWFFVFWVMNYHFKVNKVVHSLCHFGFLGHARLLEESMISPHATAISNKEPSLGLKTYVVWFLCQLLVN